MDLKHVADIHSFIPQKYTFSKKIDGVAEKLPQQVLLHSCGHDLLLTTSSTTFPSYSHLFSIRITHALSLAENSLGNRSQNCRLSLATKSSLASVKAEHCDV